ncbi:MAG: response regulator [Candidatus Tectomicrobia bacterium]|nr:response regulator [Candidatus Tectomicrobia bacterium]
MARVLIVDDETDALLFLEDEIASLRHEVATAPDGLKALEKAREWDPHLVLLDVRMPEMDGIATLKKLKEYDPRIAVIMMTALRDEEVAKQALQFGAFDYVTKPINLGRLKMLVETKLIDVLG